MQAIRDAEFVVSTSFHGTAFSLIFEKQFIATGLQKNADRVQTLLNSIGIATYYHTTPHNMPVINYNEVNKQLDILRTVSQSLLLQAIHN